MNKLLILILIILMPKMFTAAQQPISGLYDNIGAVVSNPALLDIVFSDYMNKFRKTYHNHDEYIYKKHVFRENLKVIERINNNKNYTWKASVNQFTDMTPDQVTSTLLFPIRKPVSANHIQSLSLKGSKCMTDIDWRKKGKVTRVKSQGQCGSCWMFAANDALESSWAIAKKISPPKEFSVQQSGECCIAKPSQDICQGGFSNAVFDTFINSKGYKVMYEASFPYKGTNLGICPRGTFMLPPSWRFDKSLGVNRSVITWEYTSKNEDILRSLLTIRPQPIYVFVDRLFMYYQSGIFNVEANPKNSVNHAILAVGYNCSKGGRYWIAKNSWSSRWGENGYIRLAMGPHVANMYSVIMNTPVPI